MCMLAGTVLLLPLLEEMMEIIMIELTSKFQKIFFGGHRIVWGLIRIAGGERDREGLHS